MYGDLEAPSQKTGSGRNAQGEDDDFLLPPPEPPTDLIDFDESEWGNASDRKERVIDDTPREESNMGDF